MLPRNVTCTYADAFLGVAFFLGAEVFFLGAALVEVVPLDTRPDFVLVSTAGLSTTAGAEVGSFRVFFALAFGFAVDTFFAVLVVLGFVEDAFFADVFLVVALDVDDFATEGFLVADAFGAGSFLTSFTVPDGPLGNENSLLSAPFLTAALNRPSKRSVSTPL